MADVVLPSEEQAKVNDEKKKIVLPPEELAITHRFANVIREYQMNNKLSQKSMAHLLKYKNAVTLSILMNGHQKLSRVLVYRAAELTNVRLEWILFGEGEKYSQSQKNTENQILIEKIKMLENTINQKNEQIQQLTKENETLSKIIEKLVSK